MSRTLLARHAESRVLRAMAASKAVCIVGPRQSGKTTLARQLLAGGRFAGMVSFDDPATLRAAEADPSGFLADAAHPLVIDEVQRVPELLLALKYRLDQGDERGQYLMTGSVDLATTSTIPDSLPGRVVYVRLDPLTQSEIDGVEVNAVDRMFDRFSDIRSFDAPVGRSAYAQRIVVGGFPDGYRRDDADRSDYFESYVDTLLGRDRPLAGTAWSRDRARAVLSALAARSGALANDAATAQAAAVDPKTARAYIERLEQLFLVRSTRAWSRNLGKRLVKSPKLYIADTGLWAALVGASAARIVDDRHGTLAGMAFETFAVNEILRYASLARQPVRSFHYRDVAQREVDLVLERHDGTMAAVEVKASATVRAEDFRGLRHLRDQSGDAFVAGAVLYTGSAILPFGDRLQAVPLRALWAPSGPSTSGVDPDQRASGARA